MTSFTKKATLLVGATFVLHCGALRSSPSQPLDFQNFNISARSIGIEAKEIALTLDDGPGQRTEELANWLRANNIPATFFYGWKRS